jgi:hypothetical protein
LRFSFVGGLVCGDVDMREHPLVWYRVDGGQAALLGALRK